MVGSNVANVGNWNADNGLDVPGWHRSDTNVNIRAARWIVSSIAWWNVSSHQASFLFLEELFVALSIFYLLMIEYHDLTLEVFLINQVLCLFAVRFLFYLWIAAQLTTTQKCLE